MPMLWQHAVRLYNRVCKNARLPASPASACELQGFCRLVIVVVWFND